MLDGNKNLIMRSLIKNQKTKIVSYLTVMVIFFGLVSCYDDYIKDYDYTAVYFGTQRPLRTLVARTGSEYLEFRIGVALGGVRENVKGYTAEFMLDPELLNTIDGANKFTLLPESCYSIENANNTFIIPKGKVLGDCPVKINKNDFVNLPGSLDNTYALPVRLLSTTADSIRDGKDYTIIVIKYIDEHSGYYFKKGWQAEWDGTVIDPETTIEYDLSENKIRMLTTRSLTQYTMHGMGIHGNANGTADAGDRLLINLVSGVVTLETNSGSNVIEDLGSGYNPNEKLFILNYIYTKGGKKYKVSEELYLRQDVEKELRFEPWLSK